MNLLIIHVHYNTNDKYCIRYMYFASILCLTSVLNVSVSRDSTEMWYQVSLPRPSWYLVSVPGLRYQLFK